jgi:hypothetical protein
MVESERNPRLELPLGDTPPRSPHARWWLVVTTLAAVGVALVRPAFGVLVFAAGAVLSLVFVLRVRRRGAGSVTVTERGVDRVDGRGSARLVDFGEPFGVTVLAAPSRERALLAFTTRDRTRFLSVEAGHDVARDALRELLADSATIADGDAMASAGPALRAEDAVRLLRAVRARSERAMGRLLLTTAEGEPLVLDGAELQIGGRTFDLRAPLEWRAFMFHEAVGASVTLYQATWIRQSGAEVVLVAPMPAEVALPSRTRSDVALHPSAVRDLRLLPSHPEAPPPPELRRAVERVFMTPLRRALDAAPRPSRNAPPTRVGSGAEV